MPHAHRAAAVVTLLLLVAGAILLSAAARDPAAIRFAGVSLLWWYAGIAPVAGAVMTIAALLTPRR